MRPSPAAPFPRAGGRAGCVSGDRSLSPGRLQEQLSTWGLEGEGEAARPGLTAARSFAVQAGEIGAGVAMERGRPASSPRSAESAAPPAAARDWSPGPTGTGPTGLSGVAARSGGGRPAAANAARERSRVQTLRHAFLELQRTLPSVPPDTKLSKLDVLLLATTYIAHLTRSLQDDTDAPGDPGLGALRGDGYLHPVKVGDSSGLGALEPHCHRLSRSHGSGIPPSHLGDGDKVPTARGCFLTVCNLEAGAFNSTWARTQISQAW